MRPPETIESLTDRFQSNIKADKATGCWHWGGFISVLGYAHMRTKLRTGRPENVPVTHVAWRLQFGVWPRQCVARTCDSGDCMNPEHLRLTEAEARWCSEHQRGRNRSKKLTKGQVSAIVRRWKAYLEHRTTLKELAAEFGCCSDTVASVLAARGLPTRADLKDATRPEDPAYRREWLKARQQHAAIQGE